MYEEDEAAPPGDADAVDDYHDDDDENHRPIVYGALCLQLFLQSSATATAVALVPIISQLHNNNNKAAANNNTNDQQEEPTSQFATRMTSSAVLGCALGKLFLGPLPDVIGARTASLYFSMALSAALLLLLHERTAIPAAFLVEFCSAVQWPCVVIILATHKQLDQGVFWASLASRVGTVCGHVLTVKYWRWMVVAAAWWAAISASIIYHFVRDSPEAVDLPNNPVDPIVLRTWFPEEYKKVRPWSFCKLLRLAVFTVQRNIYPSIRHIVHSGSFWMLAVAHTGASLVKTSERVTRYHEHGTRRRRRNKE
jgi:MFS family permease